VNLNVFWKFRLSNLILIEHSVTEKNNLL